MREQQDEVRTRKWQGSVCRAMWTVARTLAFALSEEGAMEGLRRGGT